MEKGTKIILTLSDREMNGKRQVLARCLICKRLEARIKTDIWVIPDIFLDGKIDATKKQVAEYGSKAVHDAQSRVSLFVGAMSNVISETRAAAQSHIFQGDTSKEWKEWIQRIMFLDRDNLYQHWGKVADWTYRQMRDAVREQEEKIRAEEQAKAEEQAAREQEENLLNEKTIYDYIMEYSKKGISDKRSGSYRTLARYLLTWQLYKKRIVKGQRGFVVDYRTIKTEDILDFKNFLKTEHELRKDQASKKVFESIDEAVDKEIPIKCNRRTRKDEKKITNDKGETEKIEVFTGRTQNYITDVLKKLSAVFKYIKDVYNIDIDNPVTKETKEAQVYADPYYLKKEERDIIATFDLSKEKKGVQECRDIFIFQCYTGMRYGDLCRLTKNNVSGDNLIYSPNKTRKVAIKNVEVPLLKVAKALIEKYRGQDPKGRLFPFSSPTTYRDTLKRLFGQCGITRKVVCRNPITKLIESTPINEIAASHLARRTFIGILYKEVKDPDLIGKMTGHVEGSKAFARYRKIDEDDLRETIQYLN